MAWVHPPQTPTTCRLRSSSIRNLTRSALNSDRAHASSSAACADASASISALRASDACHPPASSAQTNYTRAPINGGTDVACDVELVRSLCDAPTVTRHAVARPVRSSSSLSSV